MVSAPCLRAGRARVEWSKRQTRRLFWQPRFAHGAKQRTASRLYNIWKYFKVELPSYQCYCNLLHTAYQHMCHIQLCSQWIFLEKYKTFHVILSNTSFLFNLYLFLFISISLLAWLMLVPGVGLCLVKGWTFHPDQKYQLNFKGFFCASWKMSISDRSNCSYRESNGSWPLVLEKTGPSNPPGWNDDRWLWCLQPWPQGLDTCLHKLEDSRILHRGGFLLAFVLLS